METENSSNKTIRRFKPYPSYKDSGVEWLGEIPAHWEVRPLKSGFIFNKGRNAQLLTVSYTKENPGSYPVYSGQTESEGIMGFVDSYEYEFDEVLFSTTVGAKAMTPMTIKGRFSLSQNCLIMIPKGIHTKPRFFYYQLHPCFSYERAGIPDYMQPSLRISDLARYVMGFPPSQEQSRIAEFLDRETVKIDAFIAKKKRLIELLQEKRTALITQAVTKGLDTNFPMKDSGIEWLGKIPAHWEVKRLKYLSTINDEDLSEKTDPRFELIYIDIGGVDQYQGIVEREELVFDNAPSRARRIVKDGDVIISTVRTYLRAIAPIKNPEPNLICSTGFAVIRPSAGIESEFAAYALRAVCFVDRVVANSVGVSYPAIDVSKMSSFPMPIPKVEEQSTIAAFLDRETARIDGLITKIHKAIDRLKEHRTAVISAAVTGKIDVR